MFVLTDGHEHTRYLPSTRENIHTYERPSSVVTFHILISYNKNSVLYIYGATVVRFERKQQKLESV